jgi:hypothetical protein
MVQRRSEVFGSDEKLALGSEQRFVIAATVTRGGAAAGTSVF